MKLSIKKLTVIILSLTLTAQSVGAGEQEDEIRRQAQRAAAEQAAKALVKQAIDKAIMDEAMYNFVYNSTGAAANTASSASTVGGVVIAVYNIGKSAKDFHEADNDQQRFFAAANAAAAVATVACPPVGLIMQAALLAQGIIESGYGKRLGAIYARVLEHQKRIIELRDEHLQAQWEEFAYTFSKAVQAAQASHRHIQYMLQHCQEPQVETRVQQLENCLNASNLSVAEMQISMNMSRRLLTLPATDFQFSDFLKGLEMTSYEYLQRLKDLESHLAKMRDSNRDLQRQYSNFIAEFYIQEAIQKGRAASENSYSWQCHTLALNVAQESLKFRIQLPQLRLTRSQAALVIDELQIKLEDFIAESCESKVQLDSNEFNPFQVIRQELRQLQKMRGNL